MNKKLFIWILIAITVFGMVLRFWNYGQRFGLAYDQAHDALVARSALNQWKLPLLGPFSSAGPFQTSGTWYWLIMVGTALYPRSVLSPWIYLTFLCSLTIVCLGLLGSWIESRRFGIIVAVLAAVSTAEIAQSINLTNQTPIAILATCALMCSFWYVKKKKLLTAFGLGLFASWAASIHLQGVSLGILVILTLIFSGKFSFSALSAAILGAMPPILPILIYDMSHKFININNMIYYYTKDQFNISFDVLGRRWSTYLSVFWPREWALITGGNNLVALGIIVLACLMFFYFVVKRNIQRFWVVVFATFGFMAILVRYTHVSLFSSFIVFTHPFVLLITAWVIDHTFSIHKYLGIIVFCIILIFSLMATRTEVSVSGNRATSLAVSARRTLTSMYPHETFSLYDWNYNTTGDSLPIVLYLEEQKLINPTSGRRIGVIGSKGNLILNLPPIATFSSELVDLSASSSSRLVQMGWHEVNPNAIYHQTEEWQE